MSNLDCPQQARCPGCPYGDEPYAQGLARKQARVEAALASYRELAPVLQPIVAAEPVVAYRLRAKLVSERSALGLYARGSHRVGVDARHASLDGRAHRGNAGVGPGALGLQRAPQKGTERE